MHNNYIILINMMNTFASSRITKTSKTLKFALIIISLLLISSILRSQVVTTFPIGPIESCSPAQNQLNVLKDTVISVTFDIDMNASTINSNTFIVQASQTGLHTGIYSYDGGSRKATFDPEMDFKVGEIATVILTTDIENTFGDSLLVPFEWSFTIESEGGSGVFRPADDYTTGDNPYALNASDLDSDGDMDLVIVNGDTNSVSVLLNNGDRSFQPGTDYLTATHPRAVISADMDADGDMDLAVASSNPYTPRDYIINHNHAHLEDLKSIPPEWIDSVKTKLRIAYFHTSHGSQITTGMTRMDAFMGGNGVYVRSEEGDSGTLYFDDHYGPDLSNREGVFDDETRDFLDDPANADVNVIMWSWCQILGHDGDEDPGYCSNMEGLIAEYGPGGTKITSGERTVPVQFVYMTGHVNGQGEEGRTNQINTYIRNHCIANNRILYDFADIESWDPDDNYFLDDYVNDACSYLVNGERTGNWATEWIVGKVMMDGEDDTLNSEPYGGQWYDCSPYHTHALNGNLKAYGAWYMFARIAGWDGISTTGQSFMSKEAKLTNSSNAFVDGECRAVDEVSIDALLGDAYTTLVIQGVAVETVSFKVWNEDQDEICDVSFTTQTDPGGIIGLPPDLLPIAATCITPPVITDQVPLSVDEDQDLTFTVGDFTIEDADNPSGPFTLTVNPGTNYTVFGTTISPALNYNGPLTVPVTVSDGIESSEVFNALVTVNPINDPPVITDQVALSVDEDQDLTLTVGDFTITDVDNPGGPFTLTVNSGTNYTVSGTTITPDLNYNGPLTVPVTVSDGNNPSEVFNASVTVTPVNDPPIITDQVALSVDEDQDLTLTVGDFIITDVDNPGGPFTLTVNPGTNYTVSGTTITPDLNYNGPLTVPVTVNDGIDPSEVFNTSVTVTPVNNPPVITDQVVLSVEEDQDLTLTAGDFTITDVDNPSGPFTLTVNPGTNYTVSGTTITPDLNYNGPLTVPVTVSDGSDPSDVFNTSVTVTPVNDPPVITAQVPLSVDEDQDLTLTVGDFTITDVDNPGGPFTLTVNPGTNYTVSGTTITPDLNYTGPLTVPVTVSDGSDPSGVFNASVTATPVNDPPVVSDIPDETIAEGGTFSTINLDDYVVDADDADNTLTWTTSGQSNLTVEITDRVATITVNDPDWNGSETITFTVEDPLGLQDSDDATFTEENTPGHFERVWNPPGIDHMNFYVMTAQIDGVDMEAGDEIGIFEGTNCVGAGVLTGVITVSNYLEIRVSRDDETTTATDGYTIGHTATFKLWDASGGEEITDIMVDLVSGDLVFSPSASTWLHLDGGDQNTPPVVSDIPGESIAEGDTFNTINLDDYVADVETSDELITWTYTGDTHLHVEIEARVATITVLQQGWTGSDTIVFIATDDDATAPLSASDTVIFTVNPTGTGITFYKALSMKAYPNPSEGILTIELSEVLNGEILLQVFTVQGELVMNSKQRMFDNHLELNIQDQPSGNYFIRLISQDFTAIIQVTRQ